MPSSANNPSEYAPLPLKRPSGPSTEMSARRTSLSVPSSRTLPLPTAKFATRRLLPCSTPARPNESGVPPPARSPSIVPDSGGRPGIDAPGSAAAFFTCASRKPRACSQPALCEIGRCSSKPPASDEPSARPNSNGPNSPTPFGSTANVPLPVVAPTAPMVPRARNDCFGGASMSAVATTPASGASTSA